MKLLAVFLALALLAASPRSEAQSRKDERRAPRQMQDDERARMREDVRDAYRERQGRPERPRQLSPEERDKLRRDIEDANRQMRRK